MVFGPVKKNVVKTTEAATGCSVKKSVLENIANFTGKYLCCGFFLFNKVAGFLACNFIKKRLQHRFFCSEYSKIFKNIYFEVETLENKIYPCFLISEVIHSLLGKVKKEYRDSFMVKGIWYIQCKH